MAISDYHQHMLDQSDNDLFLHGACHIFAMALGDRFGYSLRMVMDTIPSKPKGASHVYCKCDESRGIDVVGIFHETEIIDEQEWFPPQYLLRNVSRDELLQFTTRESGGGLYMEQSFVEQAQARASRLIEKFPDFYSGRATGPHPGFTRRPKGLGPEDLHKLFSGDL